jgi:hypothetical protein
MINKLKDEIKSWLELKDEIKSWFDEFWVELFICFLSGLV